MPLLDMSTGPRTHLVAVANVGVVAIGIHIEGENLNAILNALRSVELHHVLIGQVVAGGDNNSLGVDLDVLLGAVLLGINAGDGAIGILDELDALGFIANIGARVYSDLQVIGLHGGQAAEANRGGVARKVFFCVIVGIRHRIHVGVHVVLLALGGNLSIAFRSDVEVLGGGNEPIKRFAGVVVVGRHDGLVHMVAAFLHVHVHDGLLVHVAIAAAPFSLRLATENSHIGSDGVKFRRRLERDDLRAGFRSGTSGGNASATEANDDNVSVNGLLDVGIGNLGLLAEPRHSARAVEAHRGLARSGGLGIGLGVALGAGSRRRASAQASHASNRGTRDSGARQEVTTAHTILNAHGVILPLDCAAPSGCALTMRPL